MLNLEIISTPIGGVERWVGPGEPEPRMPPSPNYGGNDFLAPHLDGVTTVLQQFANKDGLRRIEVIRKDVDDPSQIDLE
jgi:hypothetical protein